MAEASASASENREGAFVHFVTHWTLQLALPLIASPPQWPCQGTMAARRPHPKSKLGCAECKRNQLSPSPGKDLLNANARDALLERFPPPARPQLRDILRHFATDTREALPAPTAKYDFVTHGMLALASLHLSRLGGIEEQREVYRNIAATQINTGMSQYQDKIPNVIPNNAEVLFAFFTTMTIFVLSTAGNECEMTLKSTETNKNSTEHVATSTLNLAHNVCRIFRSLRGVLVIVVPSWYHLESGMLQAVSKHDWWPVPIPVTPEE
ncbi:hypothetical protein EJ02DRAFT_511333 [Clathrospora elynae]|uniref:Transcription factor domain-containing protein n=1 Tax=Clathrospora elynae TaxID=706981 RepID=A0A6A5STG9_9PLEO|nr:hypothetical protein EJ02DRAFT_511333 [Clathrospora elynae]